MWYFFYNLEYLCNNYPHYEHYNIGLESLNYYFYEKMTKKSINLLELSNQEYLKYI